MATDNVKQQAKIIEECCNRIENTNSPEEIRQQVQEIQSCCNHIEQQI
jgi:hypothetical protein